MAGERESNLIRSSTVSGTAENFRIVNDGPSTARGGMTALTREPSCKPGVNQRRGLVDAASQPAKQSSR